MMNWCLWCHSSSYRQWMISRHSTCTLLAIGWLRSGVGVGVIWWPKASSSCCNWHFRITYGRCPSWFFIVPCSKWELFLSSVAAHKLCAANINCCYIQWLWFQEHWTMYCSCRCHRPTALLPLFWWLHFFAIFLALFWCWSLCNKIARSLRKIFNPTKW